MTRKHHLPNKCPRQESNLDLEFRKPSFYPLNYGGKRLRAEA